MTMAARKADPKGTEKHPGGRPKTEWSDKEWKIFEGLCKIQCPQKEICDVMGVTDKTLTRLVQEKYGQSYSEVYILHSAAGKASLRRIQFDLAKRSPSMAKFLGMVYLGQREEATNYMGDRPIIINNLPRREEPEK